MMNHVIAATIHNGEFRYMLIAINRNTFDYFETGGWEVVSDWNGKMGFLLVPRDQEEEHDERRAKLGNATLAEIREGKGKGRALAAFLRGVDQEN